MIISRVHWHLMMESFIEKERIVDNETCLGFKLIGDVFDQRLLVTLN